MYTITDDLDQDYRDEHHTIKAGAELGRQAKASLAPPVERARQRDAGMEGFLNSKLSCKTKIKLAINTQRINF